MKTFFTLQYLEKYNSIVQQPAYRGWHQVNRYEELLIRGRGRGDGRAEGSAARGDRGPVQKHKHCRGGTHVTMYSGHMN